MKYVWDTNTAIYYLQKHFPSVAEKFIDDTLEEGVPCISAITEIELMCWKTAVESDLEIIRIFISRCKILELETPVKLKTAELRRTFAIKLPDAIIAASAIIHDLTLITRNTVDFRKVTELKIIDPFSFT